MPNDVHIRSNKTGRYLNPVGSWSALRDDSRQFPTISEARDWCVDKHLLDVEIVVVRDALLCMRVPFQGTRLNPNNFPPLLDACSTAPTELPRLTGLSSRRKRSRMPKSEESQTEQIRKLKAMLQENEAAAVQMRELIAQLEAKTKESKDRKRRSD